MVLPWQSTVLYCTYLYCPYNSYHCTERYLSSQVVPMALHFRILPILEPPWSSHNMPYHPPPVRESFSTSHPLHMHVICCCLHLSSVIHPIPWYCKFDAIPMPTFQSRRFCIWPVCFQYFLPDGILCIFLHLNVFCFFFICNLFLLLIKVRIFIAFF